MSSLTDATASDQQVEQLKLAAAQEPTAADTKPVNAKVPEGLVHADALPSAAEALAQLFPPDEVQTRKDVLKLSLESVLVPLGQDSHPDTTHHSSTPSYDPYSLTPPAALIASETVASEAVAALPEPVPETPLATQCEAPTETNPELPAPEILEGSTEATSTETASKSKVESEATSKFGTEASAQAPEISASRDIQETDARPSGRSPGTFSRFANGIRNLLAVGRGKTKEPLQEIAPELMRADSGIVPSTPEPLSTAAAPLPGVVEGSSASSARSENILAAALVEAETSQQPQPVEISEQAIKTEEIVAPATPTSVHHKNAASSDTDPVLAQAPEVAFAPQIDQASAGEAWVEQPAGESQLQDDTTFHRADFEGGFLHESSAQEGSDDTAPEIGQTGEEEGEEFDSSEDDHAIASAIERYANVRAVAEDESSVTASQERQYRSDFPAALPSVEPVDINAVLGIPRDPDPAGVTLVSASFSAPVADHEGSPAAESAAVPTAAPRDLFGVEHALANIPAHELPEGNSHSQLSSIPYRDWSFEEKLAGHHEWIESKGAKGKKADFTGADLEGSDLIGVDLRFVDLHDANLRAADLLMADLRDACLARANIRDSCLVGANLEAANLEGASLETAMGLVPRQLAGTNLHEASLPQSVLQFEALREFKLASRKIHGLFVALMSMSALSALLILMTKDFQLMTNSAVLFFLHSASAAAALPTVQFYLIAPVILFVLYLVFQFHLQHLWDLVLELPAVFPDGRVLGENQPRIVVGLLRAHFRWMNVDAPSTRVFEKAISMFLAYWIAPIALGLYWVRFLTLQEFRGTLLQELLVVSASCVALYASTKVGKPAQKWLVQENWPERMMARVREINPVTPAVVLLGVLTFLAVGTMLGVPHNKERAPQFGAGSIRRWAPAVLWSIGIDPYADLTEAVISRKPANWNGADDQVPNVEGARLNGTNFRYAQAYRAFMANAHLLHANLQGAFLSQADLRGSDLGQSNLKYAVLDQAQMNHVNLDRATLEAANLSRADLRAANLSYASMGNATLVDARLDGATLYGAKLLWATLIRTNFEKADLRESHLEGANLEHVDMQSAYLWSAKLIGARLTNAQLGKAIFVNADLRDADLRWANLNETVLTGADLAGAYLDGADMRGAVGFGANQICAAKSRHGLMLDDALETQVTAQCGGGN